MAGTRCRSATAPCSPAARSCSPATAAGTPAPASWPRRWPAGCAPRSSSPPSAACWSSSTARPTTPSCSPSSAAGSSAGERDELLGEHYFPYRQAVEIAVAELAARPPAAPPCLHLSVHTFAPTWAGRPRDVDVGLLFDPDRRPELAFCRALRDDLARRRPRLAIRFNEPYLGIDDGLTTHLRRRFAADRYLGIELEVNQRFPLGDGAAWAALGDELAESCAAAAG